MVGDTVVAVHFVVGVVLFVAAVVRLGSNLGWAGVLNNRRPNHQNFLKIQLIEEEFNYLQTFFKLSSLQSKGEMGVVG